MRTTVVDIPVNEITDWESFHDVFKRVFGFPDFYGRNMNAWIDCMTDLDAPEGGMVQLSVAVGDLVALEILGAEDFERRCPEQFRALVECSAFVNFRRVEAGDLPILTVMFCDDFRHRAD
jgi:hypothetical protein